MLSYPPIINSADLGAVLVGDQDLFIEVTGTEYPSVSLTASILACDLADMGFAIENVEVRYPYDTPFGRAVVFPCYFQPEIQTGIGEARKLLGLEMSIGEAREAAQRMGSRARIEGDRIVIRPPEYRNDFLHPVDLVEDILMGMGMDKFPPEKPHDFTIGRLSAIEEFSRKAKLCFVGMSYQEMIYNYLGGRKDYIDRMGVDPKAVVKISNPMSESFEYLRNSPLPGLLGTESVSSKAPYPHRVFEIGKVAVFDEAENYGIATRQFAGFLSSHAQANYNEIASHVAHPHVLSRQGILRQGSPGLPVYPGRQAEILRSGKRVGIFGEIHPGVLEALVSPCPPLRRNRPGPALELKPQPSSRTYTGRKGCHGYFRLRTSRLRGVPG